MPTDRPISLAGMLFFSRRGMYSGRWEKVVGERRECGAGGGFGAVRRDLGGRGRKSRGCAGRSTPGAKQRWSRTHQEFGVIFAVPGFSRPLGLSLSHCGNGRLPPCVPGSHPLRIQSVRCLIRTQVRKNIWPAVNSFILFIYFGDINDADAKTCCG